MGVGCITECGCGNRVSICHKKAREWALLEFRPHGDQPFMQTTFIEERFKLVLYHGRTDGELYDLERDPDQLTNRWNDPDYSQMRSQLIMQHTWALMEKDAVMQKRHAYA